MNCRNSDRFKRNSIHFHLFSSRGFISFELKLELANYEEESLAGDTANYRIRIDSNTFEHIVNSH